MKSVKQSVKQIVSTFALTLASSAAFAEAPKLMCANEAVVAATKANFDRYGASTNSCGAKLLIAGDYRETYLVCVSDETDPSEWIVVLEKTPTDHGHPTHETCKVEFADAQYDSQTPNFNDDSAVLNTKSCSMDQADGGKLHCR